MLRRGCEAEARTTSKGSVAGGAGEARRRPLISVGAGMARKRPLISVGAGLCSNIADRQPGADHASLRMSHARIGAPQLRPASRQREYERVCAMEALDE